KAYLARVYFDMGDYPNAFNYSNDVINNGGFSLGNSVNYPFNTTGGTVPSPLPTGVIFLAVSDGSLLRGNFWNTDLNATFLPLSTQLYADINSKGGDRKTQLTAVANKPVSLKWSGGAAINVPTMRLAEMFLVRAESRVQKGGFVDADVRADYNAVRAVANVAADNTTSGASSLLSAIRTERHVELAIEGDRFHELRRLKATIRGVVYNDSKMLLKIPDSEITANPNIVQN
ncbi:MAG TPA: RagB/SusD family nutrient uptake outer membrane protein, partial [Pelobium sp.]